jgi:hypothetical protein
MNRIETPRGSSLLELTNLVLITLDKNLLACGNMAN